jgi:uncharacterized protein YgiM (DUF1202 family)
MDDFRELVESLIDVSTNYIIRVTASVLNVREYAGTNYKVTTTVKKNEAYTIVEEKVVGNDVWGKLKSGVGWICLTYTQKI